tara:strand:- start:573 stop:1034 length:462 start_codon:yes stop_codon:yes gene_type:complete
MTNKISNFVFLISLFLLQSCSGGKIGNFLESSFMNNNSNKITQKDVDEQLKSSLIVKENKLIKKKNKTTKIKQNNDNESLNMVNPFPIKKKDVNTIKKTNQNYNPKSYRIFVILKKVDPSFPTENFSKVLRNGDINFEIEKIELIHELNQNKK